jgi:peptide/nickel transport system ATP-binding protein
MRIADARGCRFYPRCSQHMDICSESLPPMIRVDGDHEVCCYLYQ